MLKFEKGCCLWLRRKRRRNKFTWFRSPRQLLLAGERSKKELGGLIEMKMNKALRNRLGKVRIKLKFSDAGLGKKKKKRR